MQKTKTKKIFLSFFAAAFFAVPFHGKADADITPPVVTSFSITPETVDTSAEEQTLTLTMTMEDDSAGVCIDGDCGDYTLSPTIALLQSIGTENLSFSYFTRTSGDANNGTYVGTATLPQGSRLGPWSLQYIYAVDKAGNKRNYSSWMYPAGAGCGENCIDDVFSSIPGVSGTVIGNSGSTDSFLIDAEYSMINPLDGTKVTFPAGTIITRSDGGSFEIYKLVNQESSVSGLSTSGLSGRVAEVLKLGIPGLKLSFSQPVQIDLKVDESLSGKELTLKSLSDGDADWVNEGSCRVDEDTCTFSINHASHFAALSKKKVKITGQKLSFSAKKSVKKSRVRLKIKTNKRALLSIAVNGNTQKTALAGKSGKYTYWASLEMGQNTVTVTATGGRGTIARSRLVTRR